MILSATSIAGIHILDLERRSDERGYFARTWCREELMAKGLCGEIAQINTAFSLRKGTVRGMHFQTAPRQEVKIVRCARGAVYDVAIDLRPGSPTLGRWVAVELTPDQGRMLYIPEGCAHGYQTLVDGAELCYTTSQPYAPQHAKGVRYDDPAFGIDWPLAVTAISAADRSWPAWTPNGRTDG